jgi:hypothetical protein
MANDQDNRGNADTASSFGAREPRQPRTAQSSPPLQLEKISGRVKSPRVASGNDPYNTSGSFDRTRNWARIGKR